MSTHCMIGIEHPDRSITAIYCHFDGYVDGVGAVLQHAYQEPATVAALIDLGNCRAIRLTPETTVAYHRDRGDERAETAPRTLPGGVGQFLYVARDSAGCPFAYLFTARGWMVYEYVYATESWVSGLLAVALRLPSEVLSPFPSIT